MESSRDLLTVAEVANATRVHPSYIYSLIAKKQLPAVQLGRRKLVLRSDLDVFVTGRRDGDAA